MAISADDWKQLANCVHVFYIQILIYFSGVENSFPNPVVRRQFYKRYYQLLLHKKYPMKESKLCLVGPPNSGKTSWFSPFEGA